jgi:NAD(P)-dependent dehydrogenase (short-subunit alcohol dehydrogenase family)
VDLRGGKPLGGSRVLVTGGATGIGLSLATAFHEAGARVLVCDLSHEVLAGIPATSPAIGVMKADISSRVDMDRLFEKVGDELDGLDVLVNNAGISGPTGPVEKISPDDWERVFAVNMTGTFQCTRLAVPMLRAAGGGSIINISSAAGHLPYAWRVPYSSSKWALVGFTLSLALELGPDNIRVNAIMPGIVAGARRDRNSKVRAKLAGITVEQLEEARLSRVAMHRAVEAEEVAALSVFLASQHGRSISGQTIGIDGYIQSLSGPGGR